jgi:plastocyanin
VYAIAGKAAARTHGIVARYVRSEEGFCMARHHRWHTYRGRIISGASAFAVGAVAVFALSGVPAHAATLQSVQLSSSPVTVSINAGDSVVFSAEYPQFALNVKIKGSFPGDNDSITLSAKKTRTVAFSSAGSYPFSWTFTSILGLPIKGGNSGTIEVAAPPADPGGGGGGGGGSTSVPTLGGLPPLQGPGSSTSAGHAPGTGGSSTAAGHHPGTSATGTSTLPPYQLPGFSGPTFIHPGSPLPNGGVLSGRGTVPTGVAPPSSNYPTAPAATDQANVASVSSTPPSSPTALAIVAIAALAIVTAFYAHRLLGRQAARHITEP